MLKCRTSERGVTLIELMVGLAILSMLLLAAAPGFRTFLQNSHIRNAADSIATGLNLAKSEAVRRNTNVRFIANGAGWTIECATAVADADGDGVPECPGSQPAATTPSSIQQKPAAEGTAQAAVAAGDATITFNGLGRATYASGGASTVFNITHSSGADCVEDDGDMRCLRVVVTSAGQIRMCDPARTGDDDPQAC